MMKPVVATWCFESAESSAKRSKPMKPVEWVPFGSRSILPPRMASTLSAIPAKSSRIFTCSFLTIPMPVRTTISSAIYSIASCIFILPLT